VLELGVSKPVRIVSPTIAMGKREIASEGLRLDIPWNMIWSCYRDEEMMCGDCESCIRLLRAVSGTEAESRVRLGGG
ncbi:MAG: 7-cyano-7-deazaguanine synthase, partial [Thermoplasmata archaeon]|nr:7-cyano-7-deazaguanine synthase [Thermoplasmata archaeon]